MFRDNRRLGELIVPLLSRPIPEYGHIPAFGSVTGSNTGHVISYEVGIRVEFM